MNSFFAKIRLFLYSSSRGDLLVQVIVFSSIAIMMIGGLIGWAHVNINIARAAIYREQAIQLAEGGEDYYRWHLAHAASDYQDGTATGTGPYVHSVVDKDNNIVGQFALTITPPPNGSTKVTIVSAGTPQAQNNVTRKIQEQLAIPSFAKYAVVANDTMRFGAGTEIFGPIHANGGVRFDGVAHNIVTSAQTTYNDPDSDDCNGGNSFGVHTCVSPSDPRPPAAVPSRTDIFQAGRQFPVAAVDFTGLTTNLASIKSSAQASGKYFAPSGSQGYQITLKTNNTFDLYKVTAQIAPGSQCTNVGGQSGWGSWSVKTKTFVANYAIPANGLIFVEDNVWVEGQINGSRVTIASGKFPDNPSTRTNIIVNNNLLYTKFDGTDVIALIAQNSILAGLQSADTFTVDAALIAQNGTIGRLYYVGGGGSSCAPYDSRTTINLYGMIGTNLRYGFAYTDGNGYANRNISYDANLLYGPPPSFPLTTSQYQIISWDEVQ